MRWVPQLRVIHLAVFIFTITIGCSVFKMANTPVRTPSVVTAAA